MGVARKVMDGMVTVEWLFRMERGRKAVVAVVVVVVARMC